MRRPCRGCCVTRTSGRLCSSTHSPIWRRCAMRRASSWSSYWATGFTCSRRRFSEKSWADLRIVGWIVGWKFRLYATKSCEMWWPGTELNRRRQPFQGCALPPELPGHVLAHGLSAGNVRLVWQAKTWTELPVNARQDAGSVWNRHDYSNGDQFAQMAVAC